MQQVYSNIYLLTSKVLLGKQAFRYEEDRYFEDQQAVLM